MQTPSPLLATNPGFLAAAMLVFGLVGAGSTAQAAPATPPMSAANQAGSVLDKTPQSPQSPEAPTASPAIDRLSLQLLLHRPELAGRVVHPIPAAPAQSDF